MFTKTALFKGLPEGFQASADDISAISGLNRVMGIHPLRKGETVQGVVLLCTFEGTHYPNVWLSPGRILKYYFQGTTVKGRKRFSPEYRSNQAVLHSRRDNYPLFVFTRERPNERYVYAGTFVLVGTGTDADGAMYFVLGKDHEPVENIAQLVIEDNENFPEGTTLERLHKYWERNPTLVHVAKAAALRKHGRLYCTACGLDFTQTYGERGKDIIHFHYDAPLSELRVQGHAIQAEMLFPLCFNCHAIIHRTRPWLSIDELAQSLRRSRQRQQTWASAVRQER